MNITTNQQKLLNAIRSVERSVAKNISLPVLNTILLKGDKNSITLQATNLEMGIRCSIGARVDKPGSVCVPARIFSDFINSVKDEKITLSLSKNVLSINSDSIETKILCIVPDEFPIIPTLNNPIEIKMRSNIIRDALLGVIDSTSVLETRPELCGVYINAQKNKLTCAATDSFRLSERRIEASSDEEKELIIPRTTILEIIRFTSESQDEVVIAASDNQIAFRGAGVELVSRIIDGRYPDYKKVIPERVISSLIVDKKEFEQNIRTASVFSSSIFDISINALKGGLMIKAKNVDRGDISIRSEGVLTGDSFDLNLNYRYLLDGIKNMPSDKIRIDFSGAGSPVAIRVPNREDIVYVIMPLRT